MTKIGRNLVMKGKFDNRKGVKKPGTVTGTGDAPTWHCLDGRWNRTSDSCGSGGKFKRPSDIENFANVILRDARKR